MAKGNRKIKSGSNRPGLKTPEQRKAFEELQSRGEAMPIAKLKQLPPWAEQLTPREYYFVREYLVDFVAYKAALRAGIGTTRESAAAMASEMRRLPHVAQAIDAAMAGSEGGSARARIVDELAAIAFVNTRPALEATSREDLKKLSDEEFVAVRKVKQVRGKNPSFEVESVDKLGALDKLARATGLYSEEKAGASVAVQLIIQAADAGL